MSSAWGGYSFIINVVPIFTMSTIFMKKYNNKIYISYTIFYILGTLLSIQIPFIGFGAIMNAEHIASHIVFIVIQINQILQISNKFI